MRSPDARQPASAVRCDACESVVRSGGRQAMSFLLLDQFTIPVLGCDDHTEQFASICGLTTDDAAEILHHRPAGGLSCPSCRLAPSSSPHPMIQVREGAVVPIACPDHRSEIVQRFQTGLRTHRQLTSGLDAHIERSP